MSSKTLATVLTLVLLPLGTLGGGVSPIEKIIEMISDLQSKIIKEGEGVQKVYAEFAEWCEDESKKPPF